MGYDPRIGPAFLDAGIGYGGSCFPKDVKALAHMASVQGKHPQLLQSVMDINTDARLKVLDRLQETLGSDLTGKTIGLLGLAFKPNTDDMRDAPSMHIASTLMQAGAKVHAYDPAAMTGAQRLMPEIHYFEDSYTLASGCDALVVVTEWNEFKQLDLSRLLDAMSGTVLIDGRNIYSAVEMREYGFIYRGIGRGYDAGDETDK